MSQPPIARILAFVCCAISLPMLLVAFIFSSLGVLDILIPIVLPIFIGVGAFILFIFVIIMVAMQCTTNEGSSSSGFTHRPYTTTYTPKRPVFQIPMNCPSCQREVELNRVEWRDSRTIVCSGCFADIPVDKKY